MDIKELKRKKAQAKDEAMKIIERAETENRSYTEEEDKILNEKYSYIEDLDKRIGNIEKIQSIHTETEQVEERQADTGTFEKTEQHKKEDRKEFGDFMTEVRFNPTSSSLKRVEERDQNMGTGSKGGFLVPKKFIDEIMMADPQESIVRPRATVIPAGEYPDASVSMAALDQTNDANMFGGVEVNWTGEGKEKSSTSANMYQIELEPKEVAATITATDKLLRNSQAAGPLLQNQLRNAILSAEDMAFLRGNGVKKPLGAITSDASKVVSRDTGSEVNYEDIINMYEKMKFGGSKVWVGSQTILPQLMKIQDAEGRYIWQPNAREGAPGTLLGIPFLINERSATLGNKGDLALMDFGYYLIKDGSELAISMSEHFLFDENKTMIKAFWNVDGQPWIKNPFKQENGEEVSPFVVLDA